MNGCDWKSQELDDAFAAALNTALQGHLNSAHSQASQVTAKPEKLIRPTMSRGCTNENWEYFKSQWNSYKNATKLTAENLNVQLLACCDHELRRDLHRTDKKLEEKTETQILAAIESLSVKRENAMVSRLILHNMIQDRDEGVRNFAAMLKGQADICNFKVKCSCNSSVNYTNQMILYVLIRGLCDKDIQQEVLGHENQEMQLEDVVKLIEAKEAGRRSQASMMVEGANSVSQQKKNKSEQPTSQQKVTIKKTFNCENCKKLFNRPNGWGGKPRPFKLCKECFLDKKNSHPTKEEESGPIIDTISCIKNQKSTRRPIKLTHHIFSDTEGICHSHGKGVQRRL